MWLHILLFLSICMGSVSVSNFFFKKIDKKPFTKTTSLRNLFSLISKIDSVIYFLVLTILFCAQNAILYLRVVWVKQPLGLNWYLPLIQYPVYIFFGTIGVPVLRGVLRYNWIGMTISFLVTLGLILCLIVWVMNRGFSL